jgi:four helix bundle protein
MGKEIRSYRDLIVWQRAIELVRHIYLLTDHFPKREMYGLASQMRRAAVSVPSNIAEGQSRLHTREFRQFLYVAMGSLAELDTQLIIAVDLGYVTRPACEPILLKVNTLRRMMRSLIANLPRR